MKTLISITLVSLLFTTVGCERISWESYSYQTEIRCSKIADKWNKEYPKSQAETGDSCYQTAMKLYENNGTRIDAYGKKVPFERRYPD